MLLHRCRSRCEWCDRPLDGSAERHHRVRRRDGGDRFSNLVLLHPKCHWHVHAHPEEARGRGAVVSFAYAADPGKHPLIDRSGLAWLLDDQGGRTRVTP